jgi:hypothetical protein
MHRLPQWLLRHARPLGAMAALLLSAGFAQAGTRCDPSQTAGIERCVSGLPASLIARMQQNQESSNWCWAASVSMLLRRYGVSIPQQQVAREHLGRPDNVKVSLDALADVFNRTWRDEEGRQLDGALSPLPSWRKALGISAPEVMEELDQGRPLLLAADGHAMVLVQVVYEQATPGQGSAGEAPRIVRAVVIDPQSPVLVRSLKPQERQPQYLARIAVKNGPSMDPTAHHIPASAQDQATRLALAQR